MTKALIVDDKPENLYLLGVLLKGYGYDVRSASNGAEALALAGQDIPELIISDILMPVMDGFTFCRKCKEDPNLKKVPFVFYTATYTDPKDENFALNLGADLFIIKPTEPEDFIAKIGEVLSNQPTEKLQPGPAHEIQEDVYLKEYNETLVRKLESKMLQLEAANKALKESEVSYRSLFEQVPIGLYRTTPDGQIVDINPALVAMLGFSTQEAAQNFRVLDGYLNSQDHERWLTLMENNQVVNEFEAQWRRQDGSIIWVEETARKILDFSGQTLYYEGSVKDITARKKAEENLQKQLSRLTSLHSIDTAVNSGMELRLILKVLLEQVVGQLGVHAADILLLDPITHTLVTAVSQGFQTNMLINARWKLEGSLAGRVVLKRSLIAASNIALEISRLPENSSEGSTLQSAIQQEGFVSYYAVPLIAKGIVKGILETYHRTTLVVDTEWLEFLSTLAGQAVIATDSYELFKNLQRSNLELSIAYDTTLEGWTRAMDLRDRETEGHTTRVTAMTPRLAQAMGIVDNELIHYRRGALLHDIGKIGIPDYILQKAGPLSEEEWGIMRRHPVYAYEFLAPIAFLNQAIDIPYCHHEKWDGSGYPRGLKGEQIPLSARIFSIVDVWDALRSDRPYRSAWPADKTLEYIKEQSGKHFDPRVVSAFLKII